MSHFVKINKDSIVIEGIVAEQDFINSGLVGDSFLWIQTSYNNNFRKQYGGVGYTYDKVNDVFILPQPYPSWILDDNFDWQPPIARPEDVISFPRTSGDKRHTWNETTKSWDENICL